MDPSNGPGCTAPRSTASWLRAAVGVKAPGAAKGRPRGADGWAGSAVRAVRPDTGVVERPRQGGLQLLHRSAGAEAGQFPGESADIDGHRRGGNRRHDVEQFSRDHAGVLDLTRRRVGQCPAHAVPGTGTKGMRRDALTLPVENLGRRPGTPEVVQAPAGHDGHRVGQMGGSDLRARRSPRGSSRPGAACCPSWRICSNWARNGATPATPVTADRPGPMAYRRRSIPSYSADGTRIPQRAAASADSSRLQRQEARPAARSSGPWARDVVV